MSNLLSGIFEALRAEEELAENANNSLRGWPTEFIVLARALDISLPQDVVTYRSQYRHVQMAESMNFADMRKLNNSMALAGFLFKRHESEDYIDGYARLISLLQQSKATSTKLL